MARYNKAAGGAHPRAAFRSQVHREDTRHIRRLPPFASSIPWKRASAASPTISVLTGEKAMEHGFDRVHSEAKYSDVDSLFAVLPFNKDPRWFDWGFTDERTVAIMFIGSPETDKTLLTLARCLLECGAAIVAVPLANALEIFMRDRDRVWRL